ncbi:cell wall / vacuolar inhibitor of fructosidase 1-like [Chenopodium quinoa]|uniref:cell wall / vacuolar inhibitor of fructosidase 1-like n=1 Tax=Chenopodium quinoa TaxID=63459 RepID=UPI000B77F091|nr:cell wall / vacuolar inhibitor of fructosidase 1-like [Chenopodium quinoa]
MEGSCKALIIVSIVAHLIVVANGENATLILLINQTCKQTNNYDLCVTTLNSDPKTGNAKDMRDLATIMVSHVDDEASKTRDHISGLLKNRTIDKPTKKLLKACIDRYNIIIINWLKEVREGLSYRDYGFARDSMAAVPTNVELCERSFEAPIKSPISADSKAMDDLSNVAYDIVFYMFTHPSPPL